jgi:hypothetical protein
MISHPITIFTLRLPRSSFIKIASDDDAQPLPTATASVTTTITPGTLSTSRYSSTSIIGCAPAATASIASDGTTVAGRIALCGRILATLRIS